VPRSTTLKLLLTLAALFACAAPAAAAEFEVRGGGSGHGVGMSQYGAQGYARHGYGYEQILSHYYQGTELGQVQGARVRVLLQASRPQGASVSGAKRADGTLLDPAQTYRIEPASASELLVRAPDGRPVGTFPSPVRVRGLDQQLKLGGQALNGVTDGRYRGSMEFRNGALGGVTAVNDVGIDEYARSVVPAEMPAFWRADALRAQAVAARSYGLATSRGGDVFDHYPDTRSQVYRGIGAEHPATNQVVEETAGQVLFYGDSIAQTFFTSSSGGHTENSENIFGGAPTPYLRGVPDEYDDISPLHRWSVRLTRKEIEAKLGSLVQGRFERLEVLERGASRRILRSVIHGTNGSTPASGTTLHARLDTYDIPYRIRQLSGSRALEG
jgi:stage II sporulation protein D